MEQVERAPAQVPPHIVEAARQMLATDGLEAATLERISAAAGVSRMTLHRHGVSERDILRALAAQFEADHRREMWTALVAPGTARAAIFHEPGPAALTRAVFVEPLERLLRDGAADGSLAAVDARETATVLFNTVAHTYRHLRSGHGWSAERARGGVVALVMAGVVAR
jgi:AcrR family transcriptional regulator